MLRDTQLILWRGSGQCSGHHKKPRSLLAMPRNPKHGIARSDRGGCTLAALERPGFGGIATGDPGFGDMRAANSALGLGIEPEVRS